MCRFGTIGPMKTKSKAKRRIKSEKIYHFNVKCSFAIQFSFTESEVEQDSEGSKGDFSPTPKALRNLAKELTNAFQELYAIDDIEAHADFDDLLGVVEE